MVYINGRFLSQRITGIQRFAYEICRALQQIGFNFVLLAPDDIRNEYDLTGLSVQVIGGKGSHFWEQVTLPFYMKHHCKGEWLVCLSGLSPVCYSKTILTIHDISYLLKPRAYSLLYTLYYKVMTPLSAHRAKKILTVSEFSKSEIGKYIGVEKEKITVVYNAVRTYTVPLRTDDSNYLLAVGSLMQRKNIKRLLEAYSSLKNPDFELYIAGDVSSSFADAGLNTYASVKGIRFLGYVETETLMRLYRNATAYINPSLYEGFGIPLVEAMMQACPVVASDIPAFHEVCGDAALYFNPLDITDIQTQMNRIMHDAPLRTQLVKRGSQQVKRFSWEQSARVIQQVLSEL